MKPHQHLTLIPNRHRARQLRIFRGLVVDYFARSQRDTDDLPMDWEGAQLARSHIHQMLPRVIQIVRAAGLGGWTATRMDTDPGPALGRVEVLEQIFSPRYADGMEQEILDVIDMALGVYDGDMVVAVGRTINPFHYAGSVLAFLARGPRRILSALGVRGPSSPRVLAADLARLEAAVARLTDVEDLIEARFATLQERQTARQAEAARQLAELAERLDFAERVLAEPRPADRLPAPKRPDLITPV